ncbi:MAG: aminoglycoside phosphotransferase family protein [Bacillota bacterium]
MLTINKKTLKKRLEKKLGKIDELLPIGNHNLRRHFVYMINCGNRKYIIKIYYLTISWHREVFSLNHFSKTSVLVPKVINYGVFDDGIEWAMIEKIEGRLLVDIFDRIKSKDLLKIYKELGNQLALIHSSVCKKNTFGSLNYKGEIKEGFQNYEEYVRNRMKPVLKRLDLKKQDDPQLIGQAVNKFNSMFHVIDDVDEGCLYHGDFKPRNILIKKVNNTHKLSGILDFEQTELIDVDKELVDFYLNLKENNSELAKAFKNGYEQIRKIDENALGRKKCFYRLYDALKICSWSRDIAYDYYLKSFNRIKKIVKN